MGQTVDIRGTSLTVVEHDSQRVVTLAMVDEVHGRPEGTARKRFNDNKARFVEGEDYFVRNSDEARAMGITAPNGLMLLTESGYLMLVKSFTDDLAWEVQRSLVNNYFRVKAEAPRYAPAITEKVNAHIEADRLMRSRMTISRLLGLDRNQAALSSAQSAKKITGIDPMAELGVMHLIAPVQERLLTPTQIGAELGLSNRAINKLFGDHDYHTKSPAGGYEATEKGKPYSRLVDTNKKQGGAPVMQLRWFPSVIPVVKGWMN